MKIVFRFRGLIFSALFVLYLIFFDPLVAMRLSSAPIPDWPAFCVLFALQLIELLGLVLKRTMSAYYDYNHPVSEMKMLIYCLLPAMFHMMLAFILGMLTVERFNNRDIPLTFGWGYYGRWCWSL